jgi:VWFA-related protein
MVRSLALIAFAAITAVSAPLHQSPDGDRQLRIAVDVNLVVFNVTVMDSKGRNVSGLKATDFRVVAGGQPQEIRLFSPEDAPATIGVVIDNSGSMRDKRTEVQLAALAFVDAGNPEDELFLINFNESVFTSLPFSMPFTSDVGTIRAALQYPISGGRTALYDALAAGLSHIQTGRMQRKAIVVLSDGGDNASRLTLDRLLRLAQGSDATIYPIGIYGVEDHDRNPGVLRKIAQASGGRAFFPSSLRQMEQVWRSVAADIRSQYTIGFAPQVGGLEGVFQSVKIQASHNNRDLRVITRDGYIAPAFPASDAR